MNHSEIEKTPIDFTKIKIETERLLLVPALKEYAGNIFSEYREPVTHYMNNPPPKDRETVERRSIEREKEMKEGRLLFMAATLKGTGEFLGCFALEDLDQKTPELGGWLKEGVHGKGFGREAVAALKKWAVENLGFEAFKWPCAKENDSSCKLAESLGGKVIREYQKTSHTGSPLNYVEYVIPSAL
jgi:RimJ/RimL family protein N-acetyltransferase